MRGAAKAIVIVLGILLALWAAGAVVHILQALVPFAVVLGIVYVAYLATSKDKRLPWQKRDSLP